MKFAKSSKVHYTRYADDISISTNLKKLPASVGYIKDNKIVLGNLLEKIISGAGFVINGDKVRYAFPYNRQEVTGIIVNSKLNVNRKFVRQIRSMLHAWEKFGIVDATKKQYHAIPN